MNVSHSDALDESLLAHIASVAQAAGGAIAEIYGRDDVGETLKADRSPLTDADIAANRVIVEELARIAPWPVISEESNAVPYAERSSWERFWLVDPLDGTKEFLARNGEFTVNIALIDRGVPILGVVHAPVIGRTYRAARGLGAWRSDGGEAVRIRAADWRSSRLKVVASRTHAGPLMPGFLARLADHDLVSIGSSLKLCLVADGSAHLYPRFGPTSEWDVGAADAIVREAGGAVTDLEGRPLRYNKADVLNPWFIVSGQPPYPWHEAAAKVLARASE